jgi:hypothetical protein
MGDRLNCELSESRGMRAVAPKREQRTATLDWKWLSSELHADIAREQYRFQHTSGRCSWCSRV